MRRKRSRWIQGALKKHRRGALHRQLGISISKKIPLALLRRAARKAGILGRRARLALVLRKVNRKKRRR